MTTGAPTPAIAGEEQPERVESNRPAAQPVGTLLSVNVGLPKDVPWEGRIVFTGVFKDPVPGSRRVGRLNVDGDGQGDLAGHGGEQRAVFVYQIDSYRYWERELGRDDFVYGQFGENFTVQGLPDDEVCIGDRYQIGSAIFEVTQPRVTCYRVGIRMNDPRIPALLVSHHRPGFYFRVLEEGEVQAGDEIIKLSSGPEQMSVADVDALLYLPGHTRQGLLRALRVPALSPGWQGSFRALLNEEPGSGNAGLAVTSPPPAWPGFRELTVTAITRESESAISIRLEDPTGTSLPAARPGQYLTLRVRPDKRQGAVLRNYSLSGPPGAGYYQVTVKRETRGAASGYLHGRLAVGDELDVAAPRGTFILDETQVPVLLISAGIGATPVLAMLEALAQERSHRDVWWLYGARDGREHPFAAETRALLTSLPNARARVYYSRPTPNDLRGRDFDTAGRLTASVLAEMNPPPDAEAYLCGPTAFMDEIERGSGRLRVRCTPRPHRTVRARTRHDAGNRRDACAGAPPTDRPARKRPGDRVRTKRPHDPMEQRLRQPARTRRVLRCTRPLVMPHRRLSHVRDGADCRECRLQPRPSRGSRSGKRAHLLLTAPRRHSARSVTGSRRLPAGDELGHDLRCWWFGQRSQIHIQS